MKYAFDESRIRRNAPPRYRSAASWILPVAAVLLAGCSIYRSTQFVFTYGDSERCRHRLKYDNGCIIDLPSIGYLMIKGAVRGAGDNQEQLIDIRLIPLAGMSARWSSNELLFIDLERRDSKRLPVLKTDNVIGGNNTEADLTHYKIVGYSWAAIEQQPAVARAELRLPPVIVGDRQIAVPRIQYRASESAVLGPMCCPH